MLAEFFAFLEKHVGLQNCLIALSSDHGIAPIPEYLTSRDPKIPAGRVAPSAISAMVSSFLTGRYGAPAEGQKWVDGVAEADVYLSRTTLADKHLSPADVAALVRDSLGHRTPFAGAFTRQELSSGTLTDRFGLLFTRSFFESTSGDVVFALRPYYIISGDRTGTNHGQPYEYDQHVPLLLAGAGVKPGEYRMEVSPVDLAPTISSILGIEFPPKRDGRVLEEAIR
jgi:arylsulfatase A-like enzyme